MPMPSSAVRRNQYLTQNIAGTAPRGVYHPATLAALSTPSLNRSQNLAPLLASASKNSQTPLKSGVRGGSLWGSGVPPPVAAQVLKDTRPLRDCHYQSKMRQDIVKCFENAEYDLSIQTLTNLTGNLKDNRNVFQFLLSTLDPGYSFDGPQVRFEDEFVLALNEHALMALIVGCSALARMHVQGKTGLYGQRRPYSTRFRNHSREIQSP